MLAGIQKVGMKKKGNKMVPNCARGKSKGRRTVFECERY